MLVRNAWGGILEQQQVLRKNPASPAPLLPRRRTAGTGNCVPGTCARGGGEKDKPEYNRRSNGEGPATYRCRTAVGPSEDRQRTVVGPSEDRRRTVGSDSAFGKK